MQVIRIGVFETNSSSTHSICIRDWKNGKKDTLFVEDSGICNVFPGEFGWEEVTYRDAATKASYALTHIKTREEYIGYSNDKNTPENVRKERKAYHDKVLREPREQMLRSVIIANVEGATKVEFVPLENKWRAEGEREHWGYIDHQSIEGDGGCGEEVFESEETLANFIFNRESILVTDNDNH